MKIFLQVVFGILLMLISHLGLAQGGNDTRISLYYEQVRSFRQSQPIQTGGIQAEFALGNEGLCTVGYNLAFGHHAQYGFLMHMPIGWYLAQYPMQFMGTGQDNWWIWGVILCIILPESVNLHFKVADNFYISPYLAPTGIDFWQYGGINQWEPTLAMGIRLHVIKDDKWSLSPFLGIKTHYNTINWSEVQVGTMIGVGF